MSQDPRDEYLTRIAAYIDELPGPARPRTDNQLELLSFLCGRYGDQILLPVLEWCKQVAAWGPRNYAAVRRFLTELSNAVVFVNKDGRLDKHVYNYNRSAVEQSA